MIEIFAWRKINNSFSVLTVYIYVEEIIDIVQHENHVNNYGKKGKFYSRKTII